MPGPSKLPFRQSKPADTIVSKPVQPSVVSKPAQPSVTSERPVDVVGSESGQAAADDAVLITEKGGVVRKFSLGGDAWNKKPNHLKKRNNSRIKSAETIDDDDDEGR